MQVVGIPLLHLTAANNRQVASTVVVSPTALLDDGMLVRREGGREGVMP
jgi:hypothetical protein